MVKGAAELDRPVPLYMQVVRQLRAQIASGELADGDRIPSQREMMQLWRISMQTASKVIGALKTEGLAIPSIGRDTVVAPGAAARIAATSVGAAHIHADPPALPDLDVKVTTARAAPPAHVAEILGLPPRSRFLCRREAHRAGSEAISVATTWFPATITSKATRLADQEPLPAGIFAYIAEATGIRAARVIEDNAAQVADPDIAAALGIATGSAVLITRARYHSLAGQGIAYTETTTTTGHRHTRTYDITGN